MPRLRILHFSDLHARGLRENRLANRRRVLGRAWESNVQEMCDDGVPVDLVCITGDVANWGLADEYLEATELITRTARLADVPMDRVFIVPGNHDICRTTNKAEWEQMIDTLSRNRDEAGFSNWMDGTSGTPPLGFDPAWRDAVLARQHDYRAWVREALQRPDLLPGSHANLGYRVELVVGGVPVHVIGLDSAWLSGGEADAGRLRLTEGQVNSLATDPQTGDVLPGFKLALIHHPLSALADGSARRRDLADRVHLLLRGHQHEQELEVSADPDRRLQTFSAGSLYEGDLGNHWPNVHAVQCARAERGRVAGPVPREPRPRWRPAVVRRSPPTIAAHRGRDSRLPPPRKTSR